MKEQNSLSKPGTLITVDPVIAAEQTTNYRNFMQGSGINEIAFYIRAEDLLGALQLPFELPEGHNITGVRVYMALEELPNNNHSHLYVVGTDENNNDIILDSNNQSQIYDMTWPCPDLCSQANILNGLGADAKQ